MMTEKDLAERADQIRRLDTESRTATARECELIAEMGRILMETKAGMEHGQWLPWIRDQLTISKQTVRRYMAITANGSVLSHFFPLGKSALYALLMVKGLTPETEVTGKMIKELGPEELEPAYRVLIARHSNGPSVLTQAMGHVAGLEKIRDTAPEVLEKVFGAEQIPMLIQAVRQAIAGSVPRELEAALQDLARDIFRRYGIAA